MGGRVAGMGDEVRLLYGRRQARLVNFLTFTKLQAVETCRKRGRLRGEAGEGRVCGCGMLGGLLGGMTWQL